MLKTSLLSAEGLWSMLIVSAGLRPAVPVAGFGLLLHAVKRAAIAKAVIVCLIISISSGVFVEHVIAKSNGCTTHHVSTISYLPGCPLCNTNSYFLEIKKLDKRFQ